MGSSVASGLEVKVGRYVILGEDGKRLIDSETDSPIFLWVYEPNNIFITDDGKQIERVFAWRAFGNKLTKCVYYKNSFTSKSFEYVDQG